MITGYVHYSKCTAVEGQVQAYTHTHLVPVIYQQKAVLNIESVALTNGGTCVMYNHACVCVCVCMHARKCTQPFVILPHSLKY